MELIDGFQPKVFTMKACHHHPENRCYHSTCAFLDKMGNVCLCRWHPNRNGFFMRRKVVFPLPSVFSKHGYDGGE